jgi:selenophosphate synthase
LASAAVRELFVAGFVTCSAPLPIGLYTVVGGVAAPAAPQDHGALRDGQEVTMVRPIGITATTAQSEQAFSADGGRSWEVNWVNRYTRDTGL